MKQLRIEIAHEAGFANFVEYAFRHRERFDYGVADTIRFHEAVERVVVPLARQIQEEQRAALGVETLRPWDLSVDPLGRPPLAAVSRTSNSWPPGPRRSSATSTPSSASSSPSCGHEQLLDLANRKGKAPGGYQTTLEDDRLPFIFMNAVGLDSATCGPCSTKGGTPSTRWPAAASRWRPIARARSSSARSPR